ncbi:IS3 family transposase [Butyricicoccus porcorum]|uniref:IS3 family transposase n=1 Tax=Butyricicoccus porcorum TaxID=1945634 RepID=UPI003F4ABF7B
MSQMSKHYEPEFKKKIVRLHLEEGRTLKGLAAEYGVSKASISIWIKQFRKECQTNEEAKADYDYMKENLQLKKQLAELQKENDFLKKRGGILCEGNRLAAYRFIQQYGHKYGVRWLLKRLNILPNAYYNFLKNRKCDYHKHKDKIKREIVNIYHSHNGTDGYRTMHAYLLRRGYNISRITVHKYMNTELQLFSIVRKRKPDYEYGAPHKVFENKLHQDFKAESINQKWCTDFTCLFLTNGSKRYNCTIIDLYDRSVIASITDKHITAELAKRTLQKAIDFQPGLDPSCLILHSDQGSQYTSKEFTEYCESVGITQSMSKAGYPYDNAPMERYYNTLKNELINHHYYHSEKELYTSIEEFAYVHYNHERPHSYNNYKTPFEARYGA